VGVGKTTLGRPLADAIGGAFVDGDDHSDPAKPWFCSILRTSAAIVRTGLTLLDEGPAVVVAQPLTCINWIYFRRKFGDAGIRTHFISLRATMASILDDKRGRRFDDAERARIRTMIAEGYGERSFSDAIIDTDKAGFTETLARLTAETQRLTKIPA
jgi:hypothetical protein